MKKHLTVLSICVSAAAFVPAAGAQPNNDALNLLLEQVRSLREEVQTLRGMVEEQGYELRRLQEDSLDRYTDLDSRISTLYQDMGSGNAASAALPPTVGNVPANPAASSNQNSGNAAMSGSSVAAPANSAGGPETAASGFGADSAISAASGPNSSNTSGNNSQQLASNGVVSGNNMPVAPAPGIMTEQQLYERALDSLLQEESYQRSIAEFDQYLSQYPDGRFVTNAYYWQGQAYVNLSQFDQARGAFETIVNNYPDGRKIEDAMYSLGTVYHRLGDSARARQMLQDVRTRFPNTSAANLADIYLRTL